MKPLVLLVLVIIAIAFFAYNIYKLIRLHRLGKSENRFDQIGERIKGVLLYMFGQYRLVRHYRFAGIEHFMLFWGFVIITLGTIEMIGGGLSKGFQLPFLPGATHNVFEFVLDILYLLVIIAICMGIINRFTIGRKREENSVDAFIILGLIFGLMVTALAANGARIVEGTIESKWLPVSNVIFASAFSGMSTGSAHTTFEFFWWVHVLFVLVFLNYLPYSKHSHILTAIFNVFFRDLKPRGEMEPIDFEDETVDHYGSVYIEDFSWKDILDAFSCTECGRCTDNCPAHATEKPLSPRKIVTDLRHYLDTEGRKIIKGEISKEERTPIPGPHFTTEEEIWACTTCNACVEECPLLIDQMGKIMKERRYLTLEGKLSGIAAQTLQKLTRQGNPWGFSPDDRAKWLKDFDVRILGDGNGDASNVDLVYWMGCFGAYDPRGQEVAQAITTLLKSAGINFAVLGPMETCTGDPARRLGEEALYQTLAMQNIETLNSLNVKRIIANCPHCFNTLKNEYHQFGGNYEVWSHTDLLFDLVREGKLKPTKPIEQVIAYHDACYLGRYNNIYDPPREILSSVPGVKLVEMKRCREKGFCCGAGGGKIWMEEEAPRVNWNRFEEAEGVNPDMLAAACYFCITMFDDAAKYRGKVEEIAIKDIAEILKESVE